MPERLLSWFRGVLRFVVASLGALTDDRANQEAAPEEQKGIDGVNYKVHRDTSLWAGGM
jgi:hypothetical protein